MTQNNIAYSKYRGPSSQSHWFWGFPKESRVTGSIGISKSSIWSSNICKLEAYLNSKNCIKLECMCVCVCVCVYIYICKTKAVIFLAVMTQKIRLRKTWRKFSCEQNLHCVIGSYINKIFEVLFCSVQYCFLKIYNKTKIILRSPRPARTTWEEPST
jgi:hypothetical protein